MARWGANSFQDDAAMDRVGDVWREVFKELNKDFICAVLSPYFQRAKPEPLSLMLWTACATQLPDEHLKRIGCLLTTDLTVAKAFLGKIDNKGFLEVVKRMCNAAPAYAKISAAAAASFFCYKAGLQLSGELAVFAADNLTALLNEMNDPAARSAIQSEIEQIKKGMQ